MCGIAGIVGRDAGQFADSVMNMTDRMAHRGPDGQGVYCAPSRNAVLGHSRLAILDVTDAGAQPMMNKSGSKALVYNGECYNHRDLRKRMTIESSDPSLEAEIWSYISDARPDAP